MDRGRHSIRRLRLVAYAGEVHVSWGVVDIFDCLRVTLTETEYACTYSHNMKLRRIHGESILTRLIMLFFSITTSSAGFCFPVSLSMHSKGT